MLPVPGTPVHKLSKYTQRIIYPKNNFKIQFFFKNTLLLHLYKILSKLKKIEFRGYFTNGLVLQIKIKVWS